MTIVNPLNALISTNYIYDGNAAGTPYTHYPSFSVNGTLAYPNAVWTNTSAGTNLFEITQDGVLNNGSGLAEYDVTSNGLYNAQTLGSVYYNALFSLTPMYPMNSALGTNTVTIVPGSSVQTNLHTFASTLLTNSILSPITANFTIVATNQYSYTISHGIGSTPHLVIWTFVCNTADANTGYGIGDSLGAEDVTYTTVQGNVPAMLWKNSSAVGMSLPTPLVGYEYVDYMASKAGGNWVNPSHWTNFSIRAEIYP